MSHNIHQGIFISCDLKGKIQKADLIKDFPLTVTKEQHFTELLDSKSYERFFDYFHEAKTKGYSLGGVLTLNTKETLYQLTSFIFLKQDAFIHCVGLVDTAESVRTIRDIIALNNKQTNQLRTQFQDKAHLKNEAELFEQIAALNSALVNTKRSLEQKNQELIRVNEKLDETLNRDFLTDLLNRRAFFKTYLDKTLEIDSVFIMIDFNNFKRVNDEFGHQKGDETLIFFAEFMKTHIHPLKGRVYRIGGDEFIVVIPKEALSEFKTVVKKITPRLNAIHDKLSLAIGYKAINHSSHLSKELLDSILNTIDQKMYNHKDERT